ncbi:hypothetical protein RVR_10529 [Actinacidiphila reveromycinica]|uniref:Uncharacterized protein n=1 Tax=Actinacidiphila reveromycinica TaxID=659352 RepID=A0A7U3UTW3_9ACTN|nr:hypothetical protein [Streptomyces sp. SN-593]BBB00201.1 hypothetical protein RVR_10529 [Streptomyces sp. SN-593]
MFEFTAQPHGEDYFLRPGRYQVDAEEAKALLVENPRFEASATRAGIWEGFERYMARFFQLEAHFETELSGSELVHCVWLGGSFVSSRLNPSNADLTVFIDDAGAQKIKGKPKAGWMTQAFSRVHTERHFSLSALEVRYRPVRSVFELGVLEHPELEYLRQRGAWDDWWQRCRPLGEKDAPTLESAVPRRGYLEVTL